MTDEKGFELSPDDFTTGGMNPLYDRSRQEYEDTHNDHISELRTKGTDLDVSKLQIEHPKEEHSFSSGKQNIRKQGTAVKETHLRPMPGVCCQEKMVICLDISKEMDKDTFKSKTGDRFAPLKLIKRALEIFIHTKHRLNKNHQFALVLLRENAVWVCDFTSDPEKIVTIMNEMKDTSSCETFDLTSLFDNIQTHAVLPNVGDPENNNPPYIVRAIFIYGRSHCKPVLTNPDSLKLLYTSPYFFLDCYYVHEPPSHDNQCEDIYNCICELDEKGLSYIFEVSRNPTKLYDSMSQLLAHPLQRVPQNDLSYSIEPKLDSPS